MNIMIMEAKKIRYPENLPLKEAVKKSGKSITFLAKEIGISREVLSNTLNGNYKGTKTIVPALLNVLGLPTDFVSKTI